MQQIRADQGVKKDQKLRRDRYVWLLLLLDLLVTDAELLEHALKYLILKMDALSFEFQKNSNLCAD